MPELPEVEAARAAIADNCIGKKIVRAIIADDTKVIDGVSPSQFESSLLGKTIVAAHRKGKNLWIQLDSPPFPSFQFGMTGAVYIKGVAVTKYKRSAVNDADEWPSKFSKFFIELNDGLEMSFTDKRRFAKVRLLDDPASVPPVSELGPDALLKPVNEEEFFKLLSRKKIAIKSLLLDQVLEKAVEVGADSDQYPSSWIFHSREKKPGKAFVDGKQIDFITVGGRTSAYVPELQKLNGEQPTKAPAKPRKQASRKTKQNVDNHNVDTDENDHDSEDSDGGEKETRSVKSKQVKNSKAGVQKSVSKDDEEVAKATRTSGRTPAAVKRKPQQKNEDGIKMAKRESNSRKNIESDASDNDADSEDEDQTKPAKSKTKKPQKQTKRKAK